jgi:hypothetical protein
MKKEGMSDKELKLLATARREVAAKAATAKPAAASATAVPASASPLDARTVIGWDHPAANATPLDQPTVTGWDHPAARGAGDGREADGKWARIAALMEHERAEAEAKRRRAKRTVILFLGVLVVLVAIGAARMLLAR